MQSCNLLRISLGSFIKIIWGKVFRNFSWLTFSSSMKWLVRPKWLWVYLDILKLFFMSVWGH
jgi:hypothetical protein